MNLVFAICCLIAPNDRTCLERRHHQLHLAILRSTDAARSEELRRADEDVIAKLTAYNRADFRRK